ncbi:MAG TPA: low affinity iron permease family protein [Candidatus Saccharimonadales bacterium]|nr:low affinity iron permease family protein [Candidatus Saccharimonadales bacterium]
MASKKPDIFTRFTTAVATAMGRPWVFVTALVILVAWGASGPLLGFSDTWQLVINTSTTIITFLMVFIIQNTQNRDSMATNIKLDAIMDKLGLNKEELFEAEEQSDKKLAKELARVQRAGERPQKGAVSSSKRKPARKK